MVFEWREYTGQADGISPCLLKVEHVAVKVRQHVVLKDLLLAVERELFAAHGADLPVALHMLFKLTLVVVGRKDDLTEWTAFHVHTAYGDGGRWKRSGVKVIDFRKVKEPF